MLRKYPSGTLNQKTSPPHPAFPIYDKESATIKKFFKFVTVSTISRTVSSNPNMIIDKTIEEMDDEDENRIESSYKLKYWGL